jgi:nitrogen fixation/metabolism regulation signal transduction histidine kinase
LTALGVGAVLFFFNPSAYVFYPTCQFHVLTGLYCPGCGGTRAVYQLLHGRVLLALKDNALFVLTLPVLAVWGARFVVQKLRNQQTAFRLRPKIVWLLLVVALVFTVLRNLPAFSWLSP